MIKDKKQCETSLSGTLIENKCGVYNGECKSVCSELNEEGEEGKTCGSRDGECFSINDEDGNFDECINMVC
jgi:hypothetical protein